MPKWNRKKNKKVYLYVQMVRTEVTRLQKSTRINPPKQMDSINQILVHLGNATKRCAKETRRLREMLFCAYFSIWPFVDFFNYFRRFYTSVHELHCKENSIYVFLFWELRGLRPSFHIHVM